MKRVSKKFCPKSGYYRIGRKEYAIQPNSTILLYWELRDDGTYCGVLRYKVDIIYTLIICFFILSMFHFLTTNTENRAIIDTPKTITLEGDLLALNINSRLYEGSDVEIKIKTGSRVIYTATLEAGHSIGTVKSDLKMQTGNYPAVIEYSLQNRKVVEEDNVLLIVK